MASIESQHQHHPVACLTDSAFAWVTRLAGDPVAVNWAHIVLSQHLCLIIDKRTSGILIINLILTVIVTNCQQSFNNAWLMPHAQEGLGLLLCLQSITTALMFSLMSPLRKLHRTLAS